MTKEEIDLRNKADQEVVKKVLFALENWDSDIAKAGALFSSVIDPMEARLEKELRKSNDIIKDLKNYIIDTNKHGVDSDTLAARAEQYTKELEK